MLLDAQRIVKKDSFDFIVQTVGVFSNKEIVHKACDILMKKLDDINTLLETDGLVIQPSNNTMSNCYDVLLLNEDYTIGKVLEYYLYSKFFEGVRTLSYCGFKKMHPHDKDSIIRLAYREEIDRVNIVQNLKECVVDAIQVYSKIKDLL
jgi:DNA-directed RNA polymerase subunit L